MPDKGFFYTNAAAVGFSNFDFTLVFQRRTIGPGATAVPGTQATVTVAELDVVTAPAHAKMMAAALLDSVLNFEAQNGLIKLTPDDARTYEAVVGRLMGARSTKQ
jgi:hypothetical protein